MLGKNTYEIVVNDMNWNRATKIVEMLVEEGYATMVTLEENLIVINYVYSGDYECKQANRNNVVFMNLDEYNDLNDTYEI